jgi:hypothetical protein
MSQRRTPTETLMAALEEFGKDEPAEVLVIFTTQAGDICNMSSTDTLSIKLGMLETVCVFVRQDIAAMKENS